MKEKIKKDSTVYLTHDYLTLGKSNGGGVVSRANIDYLLKVKKLSVGNLRDTNKNTDCLFLKKGNNKSLYLNEKLFKELEEIINKEPLLSLEMIEQVENKWLLNKVKTFLNKTGNKNVKASEVDINRIKRTNFEFQEVDVEDKEISLVVALSLKNKNKPIFL